LATTGDRIKKIREKKGLTQEKLAEACDISKGFLSDVENNKRNIGSQKLLSIANILGASLEYLLRGESGRAVVTEPIIIPIELSQAAEDLNLSYSQTLDLLNTSNSVVARRSDKFRRDLSVEEWKNLHQVLKETFG
jgi:transcriptional regulator with XRE-family HTH domain